VILTLLAVALAADPALPDGASAEVPAEVGGLDEPPALAPPTPEEVKARAAAIAKELRCPVCQGLSVEDSHSDAAVAMKDRVTELVALGYDEAQITGYFTDRYGAWILLKPPAEGINWIIWAAPAALVGVGLAWILGRKAGAHGAVTPPIPPAPSADPYRDRVLEELGEGRGRS